MKLVGPSFNPQLTGQDKQGPELKWKKNYSTGELQYKNLLANYYYLNHFSSF